MDSTYRLRRVGDNENGNIYYSAELDVSVFEDTQLDAPRYYAWRGTWDDHDHAYQSPIFDAPDAAIEDVLDHGVARAPEGE